MKSIELSEVERSELHKLAFAGDKDAIKKLIEHYIWFARWSARKFSGYGLPEEDLLQEACVGIAEAMLRYNPESGVKFTTYAKMWVNQHLFNYAINNVRLVRIGTSKTVRKLFFTYRKMYNSGMTDAEIAAKVGTSLDEVQMVSSYLRNTGTDQPLFRVGENGEEEEWLQSSFSDEDLYRERDSKKVMGAVRDTITKLNARELDVIESRWGTEKKATFFELGEKHGVSGERIRQIETNALSKMRNDLMAFM